MAEELFELGMVGSFIQMGWDPFDAIKQSGRFAVIEAGGRVDRAVDDTFDVVP